VTAGRRALVVDDEVAIRVLVSRILTRQGFTVDAVRDGAEALEMILQHEYDVIALDLMMPRIDGFGVVKYLIEHRPELLDKVIVMSAFGAQAFGKVCPPVARFIEKPFDVDRLLAEAAACAEGATTEPEVTVIAAAGVDVERRAVKDVTASSDRSTGAQPLRLLVVDDDPAYRTYASALTRRLGFWVDVADDGESALQRLAVGNYDIVILDYAMPRLTGLDTIARVRGDEALKTVYAIMLTGREDIDTKLTALEAGFDDFLTKASSEREIVAKLVAARRVALRQRTMSVAMRDLYGLATRDDLTGVFNRRFFISECERLLIERAVLNIVILDLDGFKKINDTYGHLAGDAVLRDVGTALQTNTRPEDVVARFGGDEFVVAVPGVELSVVERIAERLTSAIAALTWTPGPPFAITASAGFASSRLLEPPTLAQLVNAADRDMYKNKWLRKHPDLRPELYEYPARDRDVVQRLLKPADSSGH
jgi:two-component system cell cycle response regulator